MTLMGELNTLESAGLIRLAQWEPELEYLFRHTLVQEATYASLLAADRRLLHRSVGRAIESLYAERLDEYAGMLARHFERAGDGASAVGYFIRAGDRALSAFANQEAEELFRAALALPESELPRPELLSKLGESLYAQSRFPDAISVWREGIGKYRDRGDSDGIARLYARSARAAWHGGDQPEGLRLSEEGLAAVAEAPESPAKAMLMHETARACFFNGLPERARSLCLEALKMAERLGAVAVQADALTTLGILPGQQREESLGALARAVQLAESAGLLEIAVRANHNLGTMTKAFLADASAAEPYFRRALELAHRRGVPSEEFSALVNVVGISLELGEVGAAERSFRELQQLADALPDTSLSLLEMGTLNAALAWLRGDREEALRLHQLVRAEARERGDLQMLANACEEFVWLSLELAREQPIADWSEVESALAEFLQIAERGVTSKAWPYSLRAVLLARQGCIEEAHRALSAAREVAEPEYASFNELALSLADSEVAAAECRWDAALAAVKNVSDRFAALGRHFAWARAAQEWGRLLEARGELADLEQAESLLRDARNTFQQQGASHWAQRAEHQLRGVQARIFAQALAMGRVSKELAVAKRIQEGLLPEEPPQPDGWTMAATLEPAKETSGDFYDFIPLSGGRWGIVIADVVDKGAGAALFMALSRTLIRTHASQHADAPHLALREVNRSILSDTHTDLFVTVFYAILDPATGVLAYCNAGHHPPYFLRAEAAGLETLDRTGPPLGILPEADWEYRRVQLAPGDLLVLYTDGVTDAQGSDGKPWGRPRLEKALLGLRGQPAGTALAALLSDVHGFVGQAPQFDDLTLTIVARS